MEQHVQKSRGGDILDRGFHCRDEPVLSPITRFLWTWVCGCFEGKCSDNELEILQLLMTHSLQSQGIGSQDVCFPQHYVDWPLDATFT